MYVKKKKLFKIHQVPSSTAELKSQNKKLCAHQAGKQSHSGKVLPHAITSPSELGADALEGRKGYLTNQACREHGRRDFRVD